MMDESRTAKVGATMTDEELRQLEADMFRWIEGDAENGPRHPDTAFVATMSAIRNERERRRERQARVPAAAPPATLRRRVVRLDLVVEDGGGALRESVGTASDASRIAQAIIGDEGREVVIALFLDTRKRLIGYHEVARGALNAGRFQPRDVIGPALIANAGSVILAHNHPSGDPSPSRSDRQVTVALRDACSTMGVPLVDHLIVAQGAEPYSFAHSEMW